MKNKNQNLQIKFVWKSSRSKAIVISNATNFIILVIAIVLAVAVIFVLFPAASKGIENIALNIKKPFCCDLIKCRPAGEQVTKDPLGGIACTAFCLGVCG